MHLLRLNSHAEHGRSEDVEFYLLLGASCFPPCLIHFPISAPSEAMHTIKNHETCTARLNAEVRIFAYPNNGRS